MQRGLKKIRRTRFLHFGASHKEHHHPLQWQQRQVHHRRRHHRFVPNHLCLSVIPLNMASPVDRHIFSPRSVIWFSLCCNTVNVVSVDTLTYPRSTVHISYSSAILHVHDLNSSWLTHQHGLPPSHYFHRVV